MDVSRDRHVLRYKHVSRHCHWWVFYGGWKCELIDIIQVVFIFSVRGIIGTDYEVQRKTSLKKTLSIFARGPWVFGKMCFIQIQKVERRKRS